jgi:putative hydrolase of the HAD superfamily
MQETTVSTDRHSGSPITITAVILDYGQVLAPSPTAEEFRPIVDMFGVDFDSFYKLWEASRDTYDRGDVTAEEYWLKLAAQTKSSIDPAQIGILRRVEVEIWAHPDPDMLDWVSRLQAAGIKTALLSNMPLDLMKYARANFRWLQEFSFATFSAEVRLIKPDPAIYGHTLRGLGVSAGETLFVDDKAANIQAARLLGIHAIQFRSIAQLKDDLEAMGVPILPAASSTADSAKRSAKRSAQAIKFQL